MQAQIPPLSGNTTAGDKTKVKQFFLLPAFYVLDNRGQHYNHSSPSVGDSQQSGMVTHLWCTAHTEAHADP